MTHESNYTAPQSRSLRKLHSQFVELRDEVVNLSGLAEARLADAGEELNTMYKMFQEEHPELDTTNPAKGFSAMLEHWPTPWDATGICAMDGMTVAQFHLVWAFNMVEHALVVIAEPANQADWSLLDRIAYVGCTAKFATQTIMEAKHLVASNDNRLAQDAA